MTEEAKSSRGVPKQARTKGQSEVVGMTFRQPKEQWLTFRNKAAVDGKSNQALLEELVQLYLSLPAGVSLDILKELVQFYLWLPPGSQLEQVRRELASLAGKK